MRPERATPARATTTRREPARRDAHGFFLDPRSVETMLRDMPNGSTPSTSEALRPVNPATGEALEPVASDDAASVAEKVARAQTAQRAWAADGFEARADAVARFAARLQEPEVADALAHSVMREMGKPITQARSEVAVVAGRAQSFIDVARRACEPSQTGGGGTRVDVEWRPLGVAAVIAPWNYPLSTPNSLVLSALLTGNAVVLKPSEYTPHTGASYHALLAAELPRGVFELVQGQGAVGAALVAAPVDMVAFTGSIATGQAIMRSAAGQMKRLVLELGGKDPMLVLPGADLEKAAVHAARESVRNSGQVCVSVERVFVPKAEAERFAALVEAELATLKVGDPSDPETFMGPMANEAQRQHVLRQLEQAEAGGARVRVRGEARGPGWFLTPSLVVDVDEGMSLASDETFGPVVALSSYEDLEELLARANTTHYGLGASVWGPEGPETEAVARRLQAGMVGINRGLSAAGEAPWVGWKSSGFGYSRSVEGMRQFMQPQTFSRQV